MKKNFCYIIIIIVFIFCYVDNAYAKELEYLEKDVSNEVINETNNNIESFNKEELVIDNNNLEISLNDKEEKLFKEPVLTIINEEKNTINEQQETKKEVNQIKNDEENENIESTEVQIAVEDLSPNNDKLVDSNENNSIVLTKNEKDISKELPLTENNEEKEVIEFTKEQIVVEDLSTSNKTSVDSNENNSIVLTKTKNDISKEVYQTQTVKVIIKKVDEENVPLFGAKLQIIDSNGNIIDEWVSDGTEKVVFLTDGTYILHEVEVPEGYELAQDEEFSVKVEISDIIAGVDFDSNPCSHYGGTPLYYVDINGKKQEVYCINQNWEVPDENALYDGEILNLNNIRDFTKQTVAIDAANNKEKIDISDQELTNEQLYNKILDIIYHRYKAENIFTDLSITEIRFLTESALKNYTNANLTEAVIAYRKANNTTYVPLNVDGVLYDERNNGDIYYLRHQYKDYVYTPDAELGKNIYTIDFGKGNSFGQMIAYHFSTGHNARTSVEERNKIARYYELYQYLINDDEHHPDDFNIFIYSTNSVHNGANSNIDHAYQNLLGIVGYFDEIEEQQQEIVIKSKKIKKEPVVITSKVDEDNVKKVTRSIVYNNIVKNPRTFDSIVISFVKLILGILALLSMYFIERKSQI